MEFTKEKTNIAKGVAVCLMFAHHLYAFDDRLLNDNNYVPLIPFFNAEHYIGLFGNICISMFLFLSGYGMFLGYVRSQQSPIGYSLGKLKDFYFTYWLYFLIFIPIGIKFFQDITIWQSDEIRYSAEARLFLQNFIGWDSTYNEEWWFIRMFLIIVVLLCPIYIKLAEKNISWIIVISLFLFFVSSQVDYYGKLGFLFWQISFALGVLSAKLKLFSSVLIKFLDKLGAFWVFFSLLVCFSLRFRLGGEVDFLIVSFFIYFTIRAIAILRLSRVFAYLGKYSFPMWLVHSFFCYYYFQDIVYAPQWSPLVLILLTTMSLLTVMLIEYLRSSFLQFKRLIIN
ncbi:MAG: hypothetical protein EA343_24950 [Nodularia sp. (in: Bacteria)]|nr:MAG: hypothetical protein EA343_24950 [Nodularia sp. (in: cyanobacteria)]